MRKGYLVLLGWMAVVDCEKSNDASAPAAAPVVAPVAPPPVNTGIVNAPPPVAAAAPAGEAATAAKAVFSQRCTMCHGLDGRGTGPAAATLNPRPRNYSDAAWQASIKDDELRKVIVEGGPSVGKSMMMPGNPDLKDKPEVVTELVKIIRNFKK